ncbi:holo-[acyl-carrier-protein] synthase [Paraliobacillus quinghaiensis]|uniref:Holo-[acyl-carrier-protein] synthase n=1 Tax=Paraliobacillus quinghaiensis TaxID=470815 RepID=A0A917TRQ0_9BACI|nr:holo-ACP synthase [Paraliobacillus quinghaiensis]GGM34320.1 holo-[acyl-carrier-protein] synthase [Paraliobacillus quinghaiensis]
MILGIGIDIIEIERIKQIVNRNARIADKILTANEKKQWLQCDNEKRKIEFLAGRFAAKEAFSKAMGTGIGKLGWHDIEVQTNVHGAPIIRSESTVDNVFVSISHSDLYVVSQVIIEQSRKE